MIANFKVMKTQAVKTTLKTLLGIAALTASAVSAHAGNIPISFTGWNADVIAEKTAGSPAAGTNTSLGTYWSLYEAGAPGLGAVQGLTSSSFTSALDGTTQFQFASYTSNNAVNNTGTLTLVTPGKYSNLSFLVQGINNSPAFSVTLNYSDLTSTVLTGSTPNWTDTGSGQVALSNFGLIGNIGATNTWNYFNYTGSIALFQSNFAANSAKTLTSIGFAKTSGDQVALFAVSGTAAAVSGVPEPATFAMLGFGLVALGTVARRKNS